MYHEKTSICQTNKLSFYSFNNENISLRFVNNSAGYRRLKIWKRVYKKKRGWIKRKGQSLYLEMKPGSERHNNRWRWHVAVTSSDTPQEDGSSTSGRDSKNLALDTWHLKHMWISSSYNPIGRLWLQVTSRLLFISEPKLSSLIQFWKRKKAKLSLTGSIYHQHLAKN